MAKQKVQDEQEFDLYVGGEPDPDLEEEEELDRGDTLVDEMTAEPSEEEGEEEGEEEPEEGEEEGEEEPEEEGEGEGEEEPEEEGEGEGEEEPEEVEEEAPKPTPNIPKHRFDEVNNRRKAAEAKTKQLEEELARLRGEASEAEKFDFDTKEEEYMSAVVDGDFAMAKARRSEIRRAEQDVYQARSAITKQEAIQQTQADLDFQTAVAELESQYPQFNYRDESSYDEQATQEALQLFRAYSNMGTLPPGECMRQAVDLMASKYGYKPVEASEGEQEQEPEQEQEQEQEPAPKPKKRKPPRHRVNKKAAAQSQPPLPSAGVPGDSQSSNITTMTEDEFDALPEAKKAELRGDLVY